MSGDRALPIDLLVLTGDHYRTDATKWDGGYTDGDLELHDRMCTALSELSGYRVTVLSDHDRLVEVLDQARPDLVLNFCDTGWRNVATQELHVAALLEIHGLPYTGATPASMVLAYDKSIVGLIAQSLGVPVPYEVLMPAHASVDQLERSGVEGFPWPGLIKPAQGDGSVGIGRDAVVQDLEQARAVLRRLREQLPGVSALLQEYLPGPEYGLALIGNPETGFEVFPPLEVDFSQLPPDLPPILAFESKTGPETPYSNIRIKRADLDAVTSIELARRAELLFARLQCRDYARFDFRCSADGEIKLLEVNPNPAWSAEAKLALMAGFAGLTYPQLLDLILRTALRRLGLGDEGVS